MRRLSPIMRIMGAAALLVGTVACSQESGRKVNVKSATFTALYSGAGMRAL